MKDHGVGQAQSGSDGSEGQSGIEHHDPGADLPGKPQDAPTKERAGQKHRLACALDAEGLPAVELRRAPVRRREHSDLLGWQAAPQLPQIGLDATSLGGEVVGDEEVAQGNSRRLGMEGAVWRVRWRSPFRLSRGRRLGRSACH